MHLSEEELNFELALRNIGNLGLATRRNKCSRLREAMTEDTTLGRTYPSSTHVMDDVVNIETIQSRIKLLLPAIETAKKKKDMGFLNHTVSRLKHYLNRLSRIQSPPAHLQEMWSALNVLVSSTLEEVLDTLNPTSVNFVSEVQNNLVSAVSVNNQVLQTRPESNVPTGPTHSQTAAVDAGAQHNGLPRSEPTRQQTPRQSEARGGERITSSARRSLIELLGDGGEMETPRRADSGREDGLLPGFVEQPVASSSALKLRGRGRGINIATRGGLGSTHWRGPQGQRNEFEDRGIPPPSYRTADTSHNLDNSREYNRLRDELLNHLLRQERVRNEGARNPKAIHNWPFKFRGEKDTTTLNTFLDRVECFAQSEEVSEDVLLRSIKHLLQDDALDWYGRAFNEGSLLTWTDFKNHIRQEFLPNSYAQMLRVEASFRFQGVGESFAKFYRDISALFRFVTPPMSEAERFFLVKKNMNTEYASIVAAARPQSLQEMAEICNGFDETRMLLNRQRKLPMPQTALLEPNYATPSTTQRHNQQSAPMRFGRVHALESHQEYVAPETDSDPLGSSQPEEDNYTQQLENLINQVNALKVRFDRKEQFRRPATQTPRPEAGTISSQASQSNHQKHQQHRVQLQTAIERSIEDEQRRPLHCWNCDEEGHRFMDCDKPQAMFFCYRCGQKGYSLRNCPTCASNPGNGQAGNRQ